MAIPDTTSTPDIYKAYIRQMSLVVTGAIIAASSLIISHSVVSTLAVIIGLTTVLMAVVDRGVMIRRVHASLTSPSIIRKRYLIDGLMMFSVVMLIQGIPSIVKQMGENITNIDLNSQVELSQMVDVIAGLSTFMGLIALFVVYSLFPNRVTDKSSTTSTDRTPVNTH